MKLYLDTSNAEKIVVGIDEERFETKAREAKSQKLLPFINQILKKKGKKVSDISEIEVNRGPGSFTGLRVGLAVANAIGWTLKLPVNGRNVKREGPILPNYDKMT